LTHPVYQIETWTGGVKDHTITGEAIGIYTKEVLTDGVGHFKLSVPTVKGIANPYYYDDIALNDKVKIWFDYDSVSGDPDFIGFVERISAPLSTQSGWIREISGFSQGGVLLRRFKTDKFYDAVGFATIVTEWANDLSLGTGDIAADATAVTLEVKTKTYFDLLREISDYWVNAGTQLKKDFYVDVDNDLVCKNRPLRSVGVETLTVGTDIERYHVLRDASFVKNDITVYGAAEKKLPDDESWTEETTNWTADDGTVGRHNVGQQVGTWYIRGHTGAADNSYAFKRDIPRVTIRDISQVCFWRYNATNCSTSNCRLRAPDASNYFQADLGNTSADWSFKQLSMGPNHIYDAAENPNGTWTETGSPTGGI